MAASHDEFTSHHQHHNHHHRQSTCVRVRLLMVILAVALDIVQLTLNNSRRLRPLDEENWKSTLAVINASMYRFSHDNSIDQPQDSASILLEGEDAEDESCGLIDSPDAVRWRNLTLAELTELEAFDACLRRIAFPFARDYTPFHQRDRSKLFKLQCAAKNNNHAGSDVIDRDAVKRTLQQYDRISMVGDSILRQQFMGFVCMMNPDMRTKNFVKENEGSEGMYEYHIDVESNRSVRLVYSKFGLQFPDEETKHLLTPGFIDALQNSTHRSAIIVDAGIHYSSDTASRMVTALETLQEKARGTAASVFYVEPTAQEFPTSSGIWTRMCTNGRNKKKHCQCEAVDPDRLQTGRGKLSQADRVAYQHDVGIIKPDPRVLQWLYPESAQNMIPNATNPESPAPEDCIPDCVPGRWRIDLARKVLLESNTKDDDEKKKRVRIVPVWWQLLSLGFPLNRNIHDCSHRSSDAVATMDHQLIRTMMKEQGARQS